MNGAGVEVRCSESVEKGKQPQGAGFDFDAESFSAAEGEPFSRGAEGVAGRPGLAGAGVDVATYTASR